MSLLAKSRVLEAAGFAAPVDVHGRYVEEIAQLKRSMARKRGWSFSGYGIHNTTWERFQRDSFVGLRRAKNLIRRARVGSKPGAFRKLCEELADVIRIERKRSSEAYKEFETVGRKPFLFTTVLHANVNVECFNNVHRRLAYFRLCDRLAIHRDGHK